MMEATDGSRSILAAGRGWWAVVGRWVMAVSEGSGELWVGRGWEVEVAVNCKAVTGGGWALFGIGVGICSPKAALTQLTQCPSLIGRQFEQALPPFTQEQLLQVPARLQRQQAIAGLPRIQISDANAFKILNT